MSAMGDAPKLIFRHAILLPIFARAIDTMILLLPRLDFFSPSLHRFYAGEQVERAATMPTFLPRHSSFHDIAPMVYDIFAMPLTHTPLAFATIEAMHAISGFPAR